MRKIVVLAALTALFGSPPVFAKGCIRGAAVGGVAGRSVGGGHAVAGAAVGCVVAHHHYASQARAQRAAEQR